MSDQTLWVTTNRRDKIAGARPASPADLLAALVKAVEEGTIEGVREPSRWCFFHWSSVESDPERSYCRIADWAGTKENPWCRLGEVLVVPVTAAT